MWKLYNNIAEMDKQVGVVLKQLEDDGLLENTIIFFYGDHGGPLPREKRLIYDSGLNTPMIVRFPNKLKAGTTDNQLISFVDFAPTLLTLINEEPKAYMQGQSFLGESEKKERQYIHAAADRFDEVTDAIRAVRDNQFKYIRNYRPEQGYYLPLAYREKIPTMQELLTLRDAGELNDVHMQWFRNSKPIEELFDCHSDPYELKNLASNPEYKEKLNELRTEMDRWLKEVGDTPNLPERELINKLWSGNSSKPSTAKAKITIDVNGKAVLTCDTSGASIAYKLKDKKDGFSGAWNLYKSPVSVDENSELMIEAHRIGYVPSSLRVKIKDLK
jgi:arylsulfatase A-like enzyme